jgi:hypothetical protein
MALAECAAATVLAGETDTASFGEETAERERFGGRPVEPFACVVNSVVLL